MSPPGVRRALLTQRFVIPAGKSPSINPSSDLFPSSLSIHAGQIASLALRGGQSPESWPSQERLRADYFAKHDQSCSSLRSDRSSGRSPLPSPNHHHLRRQPVRHDLQRPSVIASMPAHPLLISFLESPKASHSPRTMPTSYRPFRSDQKVAKDRTLGFRHGSRHLFQTTTTTSASRTI
jgi:hypothetical protein